MEELFAHNLHSEDKGLKKPTTETAAACVVYREIRTDHIMRRRRRVPLDDWAADCIYGFQSLF